MRILLIDNYDSFTWNLVHLIGGLGAEVEVRRNDSLTVAEALSGGHDAIVLSPGPCTPTEAGICLDLVREGAGKVLTLDTEGPDFTTPGKTTQYQDILEIKSDDHHTLSSRALSPDGQWHGFMTAHYRRKR